MDRPNGVEGMFALVIGGSGAHGRNHVQHLVAAKVENIVIVDTKAGEDTQPYPENVLRFTGTLDDFLGEDSELPLDLVIDSSNDAAHIPNLKRIMNYRGLIGTVCSEKPVASTAPELKDYQELQTEAEKRGIEITTCLPRIMDAPYIVLKNILPVLINTYGSIMAIKHTFGFKKDDTIVSTGRDHLAHEISLVLYLLHDLNPGEEVFYEGRNTDDFRDSATQYMCRGRIGSVAFEVGGDRRAETPSEIVEIVLQSKRGFITRILLDAKMGFISIKQKNMEIDRTDISKSNPVNRLTAVTNHLISMSLREKKNYLLPHIQRAAIEGPATLFPDHATVS